ncbi:MAG TPA: hypothetical protein VHE53_02475 [Patescibacteria group bacterium]|nr:hypothetical protein [Patescibacteria group bacterium]
MTRLEIRPTLLDHGVGLRDIKLGIKELDPSLYRLTSGEINGIYKMLTNPDISTSGYRVVMPSEETMEEIDKMVEGVNQGRELNKDQEKQDLDEASTVLRDFSNNPNGYYLSNNPSVTRLLIPFAYLKDDMDSFLAFAVK